MEVLREPFLRGLSSANPSPRPAARTPGCSSGHFSGRRKQVRLNFPSARDFEAEGGLCHVWCGRQHSLQGLHDRYGVFGCVRQKHAELPLASEDGQALEAELMAAALLFSPADHLYRAPA